MYCDAGVRPALSCGWGWGCCIWFSDTFSPHVAGFAWQQGHTTREQTKNGCSSDAAAAQRCNNSQPKNKRSRPGGVVNGRFIITKQKAKRYSLRCDKRQISSFSCRSQGALLPSNPCLSPFVQLDGRKQQQATQQASGSRMRAIAKQRRLRKYLCTFEENWIEAAISYPHFSGEIEIATAVHHNKNSGQRCPNVTKE